MVGICEIDLGSLRNRAPGAGFFRKKEKSKDNTLEDYIRSRSAMKSRERKTHDGNRLEHGPDRIPRGVRVVILVVGPIGPDARQDCVGHRAGHRCRNRTLAEAARGVDQGVARRQGLVHQFGRARGGILPVLDLEVLLIQQGLSHRRDDLVGGVDHGDDLLPGVHVGVGNAHAPAVQIRDGARCAVLERRPRVVERGEDVDHEVARNGRAALGQLDPFDGQVGVRDDGVGDVVGGRGEAEATAAGSFGFSAGGSQEGGDEDDGGGMQLHGVDMTAV